MNKSEVSSIQYDLLLDTCGLRCPLPIMLTKQNIIKLTKGGVLLIIATDPSFTVDCSVFVRQSGHILLQSWQDDFVLQNNARPLEAM